MFQVGAIEKSANFGSIVNMVQTWECFSGDKNVLRLNTEVLDGAVDEAAPEGSLKVSFEPPPKSPGNKLFPRLFSFAPVCYDWKYLDPADGD